LSGLGDTPIIGALVAILTASYVAFFGWVVASISRLDRKIDALDDKLGTRVEALDARLSTEIKSLDTRLSFRIDTQSAKIDTLTVAVARLEGAVWGRVPAEQAQGRS
jgi:hypothetical protein